MKILKEDWNKNITNDVTKRFRTMLNSDVTDWKDCVNSLIAVMDEVLKVDPEFKETYDKMIEEINFLDGPESFDDIAEDEDEDTMELWLDQYNQIVDILFDYCDSHSIFIGIEELDEPITESLRDGWEEVTDFQDLSVLDDINNLIYELNNCVKGSYTRCTTREALGHYIKDLAERLNYLGDSIISMTDPDDLDDVDDDFDWNEEE